MTEVLVTGLGAVTRHGGGVRALWTALEAGRVEPATAVRDPDADMTGALIHAAPGTSIGDGPGKATGLALAAAREALADAGLAEGPGLGTRFGVVLGSCMGEAAPNEGDWSAGGRHVPAQDEGVQRAGERRAPAPNDRWAGERHAHGPNYQRSGEPQTPPHHDPAPNDTATPNNPATTWRPPFQLASAVGDRLGLFGTNLSVANACAAGGFAIGMGADLIRSGEADLVLVGGADAYSRVGWSCFARLGAVDPDGCHPFDRARAGTVLGEGAGVLILESASHARERGARVHARLAGSAWSCDAHHATAPEPGGAQIIRAIRDALSASEVDGDGIGAVLPHGTGTRLGDQVESAALAATLATGVPLYNLKALLGHTGGASAALAAVTAVLLLRAGRVPANPHRSDPDPGCPVFLPETPTPLAHQRILINAYAFGGSNTSFVMEAV